MTIPFPCRLAAVFLLSVALVAPARPDVGDELPDGRPVEFLGADLKTCEGLTRIILTFDRRFDYRVETTDDRKTIELVWPNDRVNFPQAMLWPSDRRVASMKAVRGNRPGRTWAAFRVVLTGPVASALDYWTLEQNKIILDIALEDEAYEGAAIDNYAPGGERRLEPAPLLQLDHHVRDTRFGSITANMPVIHASESTAASRDEREEELARFLSSLPYNFTRNDQAAQGVLSGNNWLSMAKAMRMLLWEEPQAPEALVRLFLYAEFKFQAWRRAEVGVAEAARAFWQFLTVAPETHELTPYAFYRLAELHGKTGSVEEQQAYLSSASHQEDLPYIDLFLLHLAEVDLKLGRTNDARGILNDLMERYSNVGLRAEAHYLLGEIASTENRPVEAYSNFRKMVELTTAPLSLAPRRSLLVARALVYNSHCAEAQPYLDSFRRRKSGLPSPEEGEAWLLLAECLETEGKLEQATRLYERAESQDLPKEIRLVASLNLAQAGHEEGLSESPRALSDSASFADPIGTAQRVFDETGSEKTGIAAGFLWGRILADRGDFAGAIQVFDTVAERFPASPILANFEEYTLANFQKAVAQAYEEGDYRVVVELFKDNANLANQLDYDRIVRHLHADSLLRLDFYEEAARIWAQLYEESQEIGFEKPDPQEMLVKLARCLKKGKRPADALDALKELNRRYPGAETPREMMLRAECYQDMNQPSRAIHAIEQIVHKSEIPLEERLDAYMLLSKNYQSLKQWGNAELSLQKGIEEYARTGRPFRQSDHARRLISMLGDLYHAKDQRESAVMIYSEYARLFPDAPDFGMVMYRLGKLGLEMKDYPLAEFYFRRLAEDMRSDEVYGPLAETSLKEMVWHGQIPPPEQSAE